MICPECGAEGTLTKDGTKTYYKRTKGDDGTKVVETKKQQRWFCKACKIHTTRVNGAAPVELVKEPPKEQETATSGKNPAAVALGKRGGRARAEKLTPAQRSEIGKKAAEARWGKKK